MTGGLTGELVRLRARLDSDVPVLQSDLYDDVTIWSRATFDRWLPISPDRSVYRPGEPSDRVARFSVVTLVGDELAGIAVLSEIDTHNRSASLGMFLRPSFRGKGLAVDIVRVLCDYGCTVLGLRRMFLDTLADNQAMQRTAERAGFRREGVFREAAWVMGRFHDVVAFSLLAGER